MSASRRLTRSVSRSTARRSAVALTAAVGLTSVALVAPASAGVPVGRLAVGPFSQADEESQAPVTVDVTYELDGEEVTAEQVEGRTGLLEISYLVRNRTTKPTELRYQDGQGNEIVETVDLVAPYVGRLAVALPARSGDVTAEGAELLDGGVAWSMILFNPLGEPAQKLKLSMRITDAELPEAQLQVAKVSPTDGGVLTKGLAAQTETSGSSTRLTESVFKIDSSVLKLRDGATQLFDGLVQLADGSAKLEQGLAGKAAPGAQKLSDGLGQAREGGGKLSDGLGQLSEGSVKLGDGLNAANAGGKALSEGLDKLTAGGGKLLAGLDAAAAGGGKLAEGLRSTSGQPDLSGGAKAVADGLATVRNGVATLAGDKGLPAAQKGLQDLLFGLDHKAGTLGATDPGGLLQGLTALAGGLSHPAGAAGPTDRGGVKEGLAAVLDPTSGLPVALAGVTASRKALEPNVTDKAGTIDPSAPSTPLNQLSGASVAVGSNMPKVLDTLKGACLTAAALSPGGVIADPTLKAGCDGYTDPTTVAQLKGAAGAVQVKVPEVIAGTNRSYGSLVALETGLSGAVGGLTLIKGGVDQLAAGAEAARAGTATKIVPGVQALVAGVTTAVTGITGQLAPGVDKLATGSQTLAEKTALAADGAAQLRGGLDQLAAGGGQLSTGAGAAAAGAKKLSGGLDQLAAGGGKLVAGLDAAEAGGAKLADGLVKLDDGAAQLATGLGDAADGSGKLADGIVKVKDGVEAVKLGSGELSGRGTAALGGSVNASARNNALKVAMLEAIGERGADEATEPSFDVVLTGASSDVGVGSAALVGGAAALALLTMAATGLVVARRRNGASPSAV